VSGALKRKREFRKDLWRREKRAVRLNPILCRSQPKINDLPTFSRLFPAQACPHGGDSACHERVIRSGFGAGLRK
jgi:hypothetical protein